MSCMLEHKKTPRASKENRKPGLQIHAMGPNSTAYAQAVGKTLLEQGERRHLKRTRERFESWTLEVAATKGVMFGPL